MCGREYLYHEIFWSKDEKLLGLKKIVWK